MSIPRIELFKEISERDLLEIEKSSSRETFKKKETIFSEGEPSEWLYILTKGKVKITKLSYEGKEIILEIIKAPDFFGGLAVMKGFPYPASAVAMEDSEAIKVPREVFLKLVEKYPSIYKAMLSLLIERVKVTQETLKNVALERVETRIASALLRLSEKYGRPEEDGILLDLRITKQELADMVGTTVETAIRVMSRFKKSGYLNERDGKILLKDIKKLKELSESSNSQFS
ncbi:MAG: Crp/Fnr family transcriptional regulator [Thermodesulfovibrionales bacterium]|nr:Crp/Fnr family transcriptional regulator [Thermodesulfovibrionales bacterium]